MKRLTKFFLTQSVLYVLFLALISATGVSFIIHSIKSPPSFIGSDDSVLYYCPSCVEASCACDTYESVNCDTCCDIRCDTCDTCTDPHCACFCNSAYPACCDDCYDPDCDCYYDYGYPGYWNFDKSPNKYSGHPERWYWE